jgi:hypothetical protein
MPYPESCPECGGVFRNTGTHFTARRNEVGRHVLLELGCQNTTRRFWWDFTTGSLTEEGLTIPARSVPQLTASGAHHAETNGHSAVSTLDLSDNDIAQPQVEVGLDYEQEATDDVVVELDQDQDQTVSLPPLSGEPPSLAAAEATPRLDFAGPTPGLELAGPTPVAAPLLKDAFVRQLQLDRLTLRQMRSWLMSDEARRAIEVAAGATEATYERLALILFGVDLPQLLGKQTAVPPNTGISAEERLELQREKARIRARLRRAAAKAARQQD